MILDTGMMKIINGKNMNKMKVYQFKVDTMCISVLEKSEKEAFEELVKSDDSFFEEEGIYKYDFGHIILDVSVEEITKPGIFQYEAY